MAGKNDIHEGTKSADGGDGVTHKFKLTPEQEQKRKDHIKKVWEEKILSNIKYISRNSIHNKK